MKKFMMTINAQVFGLLEAQAEEREVTVQEFVRAVILPYWFKKQGITQSSNQSFGEPAKVPVKTRNDKCLRRSKKS
jgi:hypothetical protein